MESRLEIICRDSTESYCVLGSGENIADRDRDQTRTPYITTLLKSSLHSIFKKIEPQKHPDDDWEIPFERIRLYQNYFQQRGSEGEVCYGKLSNTPVAVKRVEEISQTKIRHLRDLNHKNVIKFKGISQNLKFYYIIMEWCPYGTLHEHLHNGKQIPSTILGKFAQQIADGMKYLHSKNIIHRDLKPSNVLLTHGDVLKISDFGTHKLKVKPHETSKTYAGTVAYMAPEVIRSEPYSFPIDIWSYGVVLWEILICDEPYKNLDSASVIWAVGNDSFHLPIPFNFPEGFSRVLNGCWKSQPNDRLTFQQICMILKGAVNEVGKISKGRWLQLQANWKRSTRHELDRHLKNEPCEDVFKQQIRMAIDEELEQAKKIKLKNANLYLRLQECFMLVDRERDELAKREAEMESKLSQLTHENNNLREQLTVAREELNKIKETTS